MDNKELTYNELLSYVHIMSACEEKIFCQLPDSHIVLSRSFFMKIMKMYDSIKRKDWYKHFLIKTACVFIVFSLSVGSWLSVDIQARERVTNWVRNHFGNLLEYKINSDGDGDVSSIVIPDCTFEWIPEGYDLDQKIEMENEHIWLYKNSENFYFSVSCMSWDSYANVSYHSLSNSEIKSEIGVYAGYSYEFIFADAYSLDNNLIAFDEENKLVFFIDSKEEKEIIMKFLKNISVTVPN